MKRAVVLEIGRITIDAQGRPEDAARLEATLRDGLARLAERLAASPFGRDPEAAALALDRLTIDDLAIEDWTGARGAERVADAFYQRLAAGGHV